MKILIQGTTNAYTTLRPNDIVFYASDENDEKRLLGLYTAEKEVLPLCMRSEDAVTFEVDQTSAPFSAEQLKKDGRLLRIVASTKRGDKYEVEEYLDSSVEVSIVEDFLPPLAPIAAQSIQDDCGHASSLQALENAEGTDTDASTKDTGMASVAGRASVLSQQVLLKKLEVARLELQVLENQRKQEHTRLTGLRLVSTERAPLALGPYSQAVIAGPFVFVSGCIGLDASTQKLVEGGIEAQTKRSLDNLTTIIEESGCTLDDVTKTTIYLTDIKDYPVVNRIYSEYFGANGDAVAPARAAVAVAMLPAGAQVEIDAICFAK
jgi:2-iminobutanoate/2-iminopropanoate deaminase